MKEKVAILGATGLIGTSVTSLFLDREVEVMACSKNGGNINGLEVNPIDVSRDGELSSWLKNKKINAIIYLSSKIPNSFSEADWNLFGYNLKMHKQVLNCWKEHEFHLIYASSCSAYGPHSRLPWKEENVAFPNNYYSTSKLVGEILFYQEYLNRELPLTILRINAPYGVYTKRKTVINIFIERALRDENLMLFGSGNRKQDFIYVSDVANAFLKAYLNRKLGIYNIASGTTVTMKELADIIINLTKSSSEITYSGEQDPQEGFQVNIDISNAIKELGFGLEYSLEEGLNECILRYDQKKS